MVMPTPTTISSAAAPEGADASIHRLTVAQYDAMAQAGILGRDDHVELLEGLLVQKMTKTRRHSLANRRARVRLEAIVPEGWYVEAQDPIVTGDSEPEPDVAVVRGRPEDFTDRNPDAASVGLVVEVAHATAARDRNLKGRIYARAMIPTYWLLDLSRRLLEVYTEPRGAGDAVGYATRVELGPDDSVAVVLDGREVGALRVADLLP